MYVVLYKMLSSHGKALSLDITKLSSVAVCSYETPSRYYTRHSKHKIMN